MFHSAENDIGRDSLFYFLQLELACCICHDVYAYLIIVLLLCIIVRNLTMSLKSLISCMQELQHDVRGDKLFAGT